MAETLTAAEALIALRATSDQLRADMGAASKLITGELQKIEKSAGTINLGSAFKDGLAAATAFAGGVATVAGAVTALALQSTRTGDELNRMSEALGVSVEDLSGLKMQAEDADVSFGQLQVGIKTLANQIADAAGGSKQAAATFQALGISVTDANGQLRPTGDILRDVSDAMAGMEDGAGKTAIATQLLGRSGQDLIPVLNQGSAAMRAAAEDARGLGVAFTSETAAAAGKLDDQLDRLGHQIGGVANQIGVGLIPVISDAVGSVSGWIDQNESLISQGVETWVLGVKAGVEGLLPYVSKAIGLFHDLGDAMFGVANQGTLEGLTKQQDALKKEIDYYERWGSETDAVKDKLANLRNELSGVENRIQAASGATVAGADAFKDLAGASGETAKATTQVEQAHRRAAPVIASTGDAAKKAAEANAKLAESLSKLKLDEISDDLDAATEALKKNATVAKDETYLRALEDIQAAYDNQVAAAKRATEEAVKAGADRAKAAEVEAAAVEQAQRDMGEAVKGLDKILVDNTKHWDDLGKWVLDLPDEVRALIPTLDAVAAATGNADEATLGLTEKVKAVPPAAEMASGAISDLSKAVIGLIDGTSSASDVFKTFIGGLTDTLANGIGKSLTSSDFGKSITTSLKGVFGDALGSAIATAGISSAVQLGAGIFISGVTDAMKGEAESAAAKIGFVVGGPIGSAIGLGIVEAFGIGHHSMIERIASQLSEIFKASFESQAVTSAIDEGLEEVGMFLGDGLELQMIRAPKDMGAQVTEAWKKLGTDSSHQFSAGFYQDMKEKGTQLIHSSIADVLNVFFPQITHDVAVGIQQSAVAAGAAMARELGLVGDKAIKFANQWAIAFIGMMQQAGKGADEILKALHRIDTSLGTSQELVASFQRLQAVLMESGANMDALFAQINKQLTLITGKKVRVGNLDEVLAAVGGDATRALGVVENAMEMAGISIERFSGELSDVVLAVAGDAGTVIRDAAKDMEDFGNYSDGTAQILEQKVVTALGNVVKTAEELGYSAESVEALGTAASLISPELLKSDAVVQALHDSFAEMAVGAHMSIRELVDSIDPPIPAAVREAILSVDDLATALGSLSGAPLSSLKEVTDRMKQFAGDMYREVKDADGKITKELTSFGEQLVKDATSAIGGMWDTITTDGVIDPSDVQAVFEQIAQIPEEVLGDPSVQSSIQSLLAMIGEQTGDAFIIGLSALPEVTKEQLDEALGIYDQWKKDVEDNPPEVAPEVKPPENPDGSPSNPDSVGATGPDTSAATSAPPPAPVPPETVKSWEAITEAAKAYAAAVVEGTTATTTLSSEVVTRAAEMLAAIQPIYGTPDDEQSISAINDLLGRVLRQTLDDMTLAIAGATGDWAGSFDFARGAVEMLNTAITAIPTDKTITFHVVTDGSIPTGGTVTTDVPTSHSGELIPGTPGTEALRVLEAGELVLPADLTSRLMHGATLSGADVARIQSSPMASYASSAGASRAPQAASGEPGYAAVRVPLSVLADGLYAPVVVKFERDVADGRITLRDGKVEAHPMIHARARRG